MRSRLLYADHNAGTLAAPEVSAAIAQALTQPLGNPSSRYHSAGRLASDYIEAARIQTADLLGCQEREIVFLSGGSESCFQALLGAARTRGSNAALYVSAVEHSAVLEAARLISELQGNRLHVLPVDSNGLLDTDALLSAVASEKTPPIVSLMAANNETGVCFPLKTLAPKLKSLGAIVHTDAVQLVGRELVDELLPDLDLISFSSHKIGGPHGVGGLVLREGADWKPGMPGGGQERGKRGGTEAVGLIVGLGKAAKLRKEQLVNGLSDTLCRCRDAFESRLISQLTGVRINGSAALRLTNTSSVTIQNINGLELRDDLAQEGIVIATGSACSAQRHTVSHVLTAMGLSQVDCLSSVRISFGPGNTEEAALTLADEIVRKVEKQRFDQGQFFEAEGFIKNPRRELGEPGQ